MLIPSIDRIQGGRLGNLCTHGKSGPLTAFCLYLRECFLPSSARTFAAEVLADAAGVNFAARVAWPGTDRGDMDDVIVLCPNGCWISTTRQIFLLISTPHHLLISSARLQQWLSSELLLALPAPHPPPYVRSPPCPPA